MPRIRYRFSNNPTFFEGFIERTYVTKSDILRFLERDKADISNVSALRYKTGKDEAFALLQEDSFIRIDDVLTVLLMLPGDVVSDILDTSYSRSQSALFPSSQTLGPNPNTTPRRAVSFSPGNQIHHFTHSPEQPSSGNASLNVTQPFRSTSPARSSPTRDYDTQEPFRTSSLYASLPVPQPRDLSHSHLHTESRSSALPRGLPDSPASPSAAFTRSQMGASTSRSPLSASRAPPAESEPLQEDKWMRLFLSTYDLNHFSLVEDHHTLVPGDVKLTFHMDRVNHPATRSKVLEEFPALKHPPLAEHFRELQGHRAGVAVWERKETPFCTLKDTRYIFPTQVAAFRFLSTLERIQEMSEVAWATPVGSGCRVFRTKHRIAYMFRLGPVVVLLDVTQPASELSLDVVYEVSEMIEARIKHTLGQVASSSTFSASGVQRD